MHMGRRIGQLLALLAISSFGSSLLAAPVGVFENAVDIGQPPGPGSTVFDGARYTMRGSGAGIWGGAAINSPAPPAPSAAIPGPRSASRAARLCPRGPARGAATA